MIQYFTLLFRSLGESKNGLYSQVLKVIDPFPIASAIIHLDWVNKFERALKALHSEFVSAVLWATSGPQTLI